MVKMKTPNQIIKFSFHFLTFLLLIYLIITLTNVYIRSLLFIIALAHLYDSWWFLNSDNNAPI